MKTFEDFFKESKGGQVLACDLDGTLAQYDGYKGDIIGDPIPKMVEKLMEKHKKGHKIVIFTARASSEEKIQLIKEWLKKHKLPDWEVTNIKKSSFSEFWDDRAYRVKKNTGEFE